MSLSPSQPFDSSDRTDAAYRRRCGAGFWIIAGMWLATCLGCGSRSEPATEYGESETWAHWQDFLDADEGQPQGPVVTDQSPSELYPHGSVGSQACAECHAEQAKSFAATPHARSSRPIGESDLAKTANFQHAPSLRRYEVDLVDGQMLHREAILAPDGGTIATDVAHPALEIGSGIHAHSYLLRRDGYWIQSPLTWYSDPGSWDLSPGYDPASGATFDRVINTDCVFCHVGQIRIHGGDPEQFEIVEHTIGCERCHGPGDRHVAAQRRQAGSSDRGGTETDAIDSITNPVNLSRGRSEAICSQCHLQGIVASGPSGSNRWSFRPGEDLGQTVTEFQLRGVDSQFRIVGHTEQLHQSACYQGSETLTCITCHDPHAPRPTAAAYRQMCLDCHQGADCGVPGDDRLAINDDDCNQCHMPRRPTNVTHAALHDHRIAVHDRSYQLAGLPIAHLTDPSEQAASPNLIPISERSGLKPLQQRRRWALAIHTLLFQGNLPVELGARVGEAQATLLQLYNNGVRDPSVAVTLAHDYLNSNMLPAAQQLARQTVDEQDRGSPAYAGAADVLAQIALREQDNREALKWFQELTRVRRVSGDHFMLGACRLNAGNVDEAVSALEQALRIDPALLPAHEDLQRIFAATGELPRSRAHGRAVNALRALSAATDATATDNDATDNDALP